MDRPIGVLIVEDQEVVRIGLGLSLENDPDIEVLSGLHDGDEVVIGPYKTLRVLKNGALLKRDTSAPATPASTT